MLAPELVNLMMTTPIEQALRDRSLLQDTMLRAFKELIQEDDLPALRKFFFISVAEVKLKSKRSIRSITVDAIAKRAGNSRVTFFRHFTSKDKFFLDTYHYFCNKTVDLYELCLACMKWDFDSWLEFTSRYFYWANAAIDQETLHMLVNIGEAQASRIHPHLNRLAKVMSAHLTQNREIYDIDHQAEQLTLAVHKIDRMLLLDRMENDQALDVTHFLTARAFMKGVLSAA